MHANGCSPRVSHFRTRFSSRSGLMVAVLLAFAGACQPDSTMLTGADMSTAQARGGPGGSVTVTVTSVSPAIAPTDTVVDVIINGAGFVRGAAAKWSINGDTSKVHVLSTTYVNSGQLKARLQVPATAPTGSYDVEVYLVDGKKGVGAELFLVVLGDPKTDVYLPLDDATLGLRSDGLFGNGAGASVYGEGVCGVTAKIFSTPSLSESGDAIMRTDQAGGGSPKKCSGYPRKLRLVYDGITDTRPGSFNVLGMENAASSIPVGASALRELNVGLSGTGSGCSKLRWHEAIQGVPVAGDKVMVTRLDVYTWRVESQPAPANRAYCLDNGRTYNINVRFTIVARTLPR